jgi:heme/copper-type cytochrome/quinol oxidase subunit 1
VHTSRHLLSGASMPTLLTSNLVHFHHMHPLNISADPKKMPRVLKSVLVVNSSLSHIISLLLIWWVQRKQRSFVLQRSIPCMWHSIINFFKPS